MPGYVVAAVVAAIAASFYLKHKHKRHPFGDDKHKALLWWIALLGVDALVAALILTGAFTVVSIGQLEHTSGVLRGALIGLFGPLAFRSPVRVVRIDGKPERVGVTYVYDRARIWLDRSLDERITRLRRADRRRVRVEVTTKGWDDVTVRGLLEEHLSDRQTLAPAERERVREAARAAGTLPRTDRLPALIKIILDERFDALLDDLRSKAPAAEDRRRGRLALRLDRDQLRAAATLTKAAADSLAE